MARKKLDFPGMVGKGENPNGVTSQNPDHTAHLDTGAGEQQWKGGMQADGIRFNGGPDYDVPMTIGPSRRRR